MALEGAAVLLSIHWRLIVLSCCSQVLMGLENLSLRGTHSSNHSKALLAFSRVPLLHLIF